MAKVDYFKEIHATQPQFFGAFFKLEHERYADINIGGLKEGIWITHVAQVWIPYEDKGSYCLMEIGLSDELPVDALMGVAFQVKAKFSIHLAEEKATSAVFGETYDLTWREPENKPIESIRTEMQKVPRVYWNSGDTDVTQE